MSTKTPSGYALEHMAGERAAAAYLRMVCADAAAPGALAAAMGIDDPYMVAFCRIVEKALSTAQRTPTCGNSADAPPWSDAWTGTEVAL